MQATLAHDMYACVSLSLTYTMPNKTQDLIQGMQPTLAHNMYSCVSLSLSHTLPNT